MNTQSPNTYLWLLVGSALGTILAVAVLPGWLPALTASLTGGTVYWLLARAGGFVAYGLLWLSVVFGLLLTSKVARAWPGARQAHAIHQSVSLLALGYTIFHALILLGDRYIGFDLGALLLPFAAAAYKPLAVGLGQLGAYLLIAVTLSFYVRQRIGVKTWRALHYLTFVLYYLATAHGLLAGTDSRTSWALVLYGSTGTLTYTLTLYRVLVAVKSRTKETHGVTPYLAAGHHPAG